MMRALVSLNDAAEMLGQSRARTKAFLAWAGIEPIYNGRPIVFIKSAVQKARRRLEAYDEAVHAKLVTNATNARAALAKKNGKRGTRAAEEALATGRKSLGKVTRLRLKGLEEKIDEALQILRDIRDDSADRSRAAAVEIPAIQ